MLVPDVMRKCVTFLYYKQDGNLIVAGTAFWIGYAIPGFSENNPGFLVTANHVIDGIKIRSHDETVWLRINKSGGGSCFYPTSLKQWIQPDRRVDIALHSWQQPEGLDLDYHAWPLDNTAATDERIEVEEIGIGDEVFTVGLFHSHSGRDENEPIVRVGNIAAFPKDPIHSEFGPMKAILIEARSIRGLSGSPVFVHMGFTRWRGGRVVQSGTDRPFLFLGVMQGHWNVTSESADHLAVAGERAEKLNTGIAVVVPAEVLVHQILDPLMVEVAAAKTKLLK